MLILLTILVLIGGALIVTAENSKNPYRRKMIGLIIWIVGFTTITPFLYRNSVRQMKEKGIMEYLNGEVEVMQHADTTYTFLWIDTN